MATSRKPDRLAIAIVAGCCLSWGFQQVAAKAALAEVSGLTQAAIRSTGAAIFIGALMAWRDPRSLRIGPEVWQGLLSACLFSIEFMLLFVALEYTTASHAVLFLYTHPFFVALGLLVFSPGERLRGLQWAGLALSFAGVAVALRVSGVQSRSMLLGDLAVLGAGACWGLQTLQFRLTRLRETPPMRGLLYQLAISSVVLTSLAWLRGEHWPSHVSPIVAASLVYQTIWIAGITFWLWIWLVSRYRAGELSAFTFATPMIGVLAGVFVLGESTPPGFLVAVAMVTAGIALVNWPAKADDVQPVEA